MVLSHVTVETNRVSYIRALNFPRVSILQPEVRNFNLVTILDLLLEDSVFVSNTVTPSRNLKSGERVKEASGKAAKTTVSESGISLLFVEIFHLVADVHHGAFELIFHINVNKGVLHVSTHQKFEREVVHALAVFGCVEFVSIIPRLDQAISDGVGSGLVSTELIEVETSTCQGVLNVVDDLTLDGLVVGAKIGAHELPHLI
mmetsp:Transcript_101606/g.140414  ORF Transcript_101606/g.140414 Transcript_101606/m.140414 type:complete len:202 (+) Transcript_101606:1511-2116(+)